jgi:hypothetical protein
LAWGDLKICCTWATNTVCKSSKPHSAVVAIAVDKQGDVYLVYSFTTSALGGGESQANVVHKFNPSGEQVAEFPISPVQPGSTVIVNGLAFDDGRLAVIGGELGTSFTHRGSLYDVGTGRLIANFMVPSDNDGIAFNGSGDLYVAATDDQEIVAYVPAPLAELVSSPVPCEVGLEKDPMAVLSCTLSTEG